MVKLYQDHLFILNLLLLISMSAITGNANTLNAYPGKPGTPFRQPMLYHPTNGHVLPIKPSPNGASLKQWETRTWISTIPLTKTETHREMHQPPSLPSSIDYHHNDDYNHPKYSPKISEYAYRSFGTHPYPSINSTTPSLFSHSLSPKTEPIKMCIEGFGTNCRKSPFQGTYDTLNYQKRLIYPEKSTARQVEERYSGRYRPSSEEEDYEGKYDRGNLQWTAHTRGKWEDTHSPPQPVPNPQPHPDQPSGSSYNAYSGTSASLGRRDRRPTKPNFHPYTHEQSWYNDNDKYSSGDHYKDQPKSGYEYDYDREKDWRTGSSAYSSDYPNEKEERPKQPKRNKPKIREFHHDDDNADGYTHAHGYEKEEEEGTRFFEPSGLQSYDGHPSDSPGIKSDVLPRGSKYGKKECECSQHGYQPQIEDRISKPISKKYSPDSNEESDQHSSHPEYRSDNSGEYSSQESKPVASAVPSLKAYTNTTRSR